MTKQPKYKVSYLFEIKEGLVYIVEYVVQYSATYQSFVILN